MRTVGKNVDVSSFLSEKIKDLLFYAILEIEAGEFKSHKVYNFLKQLIKYIIYDRYSYQICSNSNFIKIIDEIVNTIQIIQQEYNIPISLIKNDIKYWNDREWSIKFLVGEEKIEIFLKV